MQLYNTLNRRKEELVPREPGKIYMYVCGPTTYNYIHVGNARPLVVFDTVRRYLEYAGYDVKYVQNFTDVDDKIIARAKEEGLPALELASKYIREYYKDAGALNVRLATVHPKVSDHIEEIKAMISELLSNGCAYAVEGDVYFHVRGYSRYGQLSGRSLDDLLSGARVEVDTRKQDPLDFALWKAARPGEPSWNSPWGAGRPGWHIECSAMASKYLGDEFDIHGGGFDLIFPHHENEIAQAEACTGKRFARYWMHNGFITVNQEKMSKSLGNFFLVREVLDKFEPDVLRFFLLTTHYRSPLDFDDQLLESSRKGLERIKTTISRLAEALDQHAEINLEIEEDKLTGEDTSLLESANHAETSFKEAMEDDFNTSLAIAALFDFCREVNSYIGRQNPSPFHQLPLQRAWGVLTRLSGEVLGLWSTPPTSQDWRRSGHANDGLVDGLVKLVIKMRQDARQRKDWATADAVRDGLKELGITLEDTPQGCRWSVINNRK
ncbi:MAG: cysteine--tRNA ligase [Bacillota bacterium]